MSLFVRPEFRDLLDQQPDAADAFLRFALTAKRSGQRLGAKAIAERLRWEVRVAWGKGDWRLNNNAIADLARWAMDTCPELAGYFETRRRK